MKRRMLSLTVALVSCGGTAPPAALPMTCATKLGDVANPTMGPPGTFVAPLSTIIVQAEVPLGGLKSALEAKVPHRVAEERDHDIGIAGRLEYTADRGPFSVGVVGDALVIETKIVAHARACAKGSCYAGCDPELRATAHVPLRLGADYKFRSSAVHIDVTKGCQVRALGGMLSIDATPILTSGLAQESKRIEAQIDHELPDIRPQALRLWSELEKQRPLPLGACLVLAPEGITEGPTSGAGETASLRFGLHARPELWVHCRDAPKSTPLPPLHDDPALPSEADVHLAVVLPDGAAASAIESAAAEIDFGKGRARVVHAQGSPRAIVASVSGEVCGSIGVGAAGASWTADGASIHLDGVGPLAGEAARLEGIDLAAAKKVVESAPIAVPIATAAGLKSLLPDLASSLSDDHVTVAATITDARSDVAGLRDNDLLAVVRLRGAVTIRAK